MTNEPQSLFQDFPGSNDAHTPDTKGRLFELAAEVARLVCVRDAQYVDDKEAHRALDLAANEIGFLLKLPEPEFRSLWRTEPKKKRRRG